MTNRKPLLRTAGFCLSAALLLAVATSGDAFAAPPDHAQGKSSPQAKGPMVLETQGVFWAGGQIVNRTDPALAGNKTLLGQAYVEYFIPQKKRKNAIPVVITGNGASRL
jgi:hypothetical protein